ncbi:hypothetical protein FIBSPDRAFT_868722, partial [Athelia psychrophila]
MSGPKTAKVGATVKYEVPYAPEGVYVNDLSVDTTTGQRVHGSVIDVGSATIHQVHQGGNVQHEGALPLWIYLCQVQPCCDCRVI